MCISVSEANDSFAVGASSCMVLLTQHRSFADRELAFSFASGLILEFGCGTDHHLPKVDKASSLVGSLVMNGTQFGSQLHSM